MPAAEALGRDCSGKAPPPAASSVASEGGSRVSLSLPEGGEKILRVSLQEKCILMGTLLDSVHLPR